MSEDLIKRLVNPPFGTETSERNLMAQAAAALAAKDAEIARLREALDFIAGYASQEPRIASDEVIIDRARAALGPAAKTGDE